MKLLGPCNQSRGPRLLVKPQPFYKVAQVETRLESGTPNPLVFCALPSHHPIAICVCSGPSPPAAPAVVGRQREGSILRLLVWWPPACLSRVFEPVFFPRGAAPFVVKGAVRDPGILPALLHPAS